MLALIIPILNAVLGGIIKPFLDHTPDTLRTTSIAFGGADRNTLIIAEAGQGVVRWTRLPRPGQLLYSHR